MHELLFNNLTDFKVDDFKKLYYDIFESAVKKMEIDKNLSFSINFIDENEARNMNINYRNKDYIPDVLSFNIDTSYNPEYQAEDNQVELGDIFICQEEAQRKALRYNHTLREEMAFLFIHGFLHLMGFDHELSQEEEEKMFHYQDQILKEIGIEYKITFDEQDYLRG
ncbi:rRNA maturation RNase YbeY [Spiroplasma alleghenense]|uniref:Endoribonuclease YbeY n=1 Tax=Spiroplasma alleghenense TaxID=216931 RepID=A0A345Z3C0_9MOLU|nr:rRNA maturation RNase YbeY [Spiroplasma alleghenense]AXK51099.1 16S rRNA maturation RNase YbeY [Spiroplasma alleghenense]